VSKAFWFASTVLAACLGASGTPSAQPTREFRPGAPAELRTDIVKAVSFEAHKNDGAALVEGDLLTFTFRIQNVSSEPLDGVNWTVFETDRTSAPGSARLSPSGRTWPVGPNGIAGAKLTLPAVYSRHAHGAGTDPRKVLHPQEGSVPASNFRLNGSLETTVRAVTGRQPRSILMWAIDNE
jgi:hypothetical protein